MNNALPLQWAGVSSQTSSSTSSTSSIVWKRWNGKCRFGKGQTILIEGDKLEPPITELRHLGTGAFASVFEVKVDGREDICALKAYTSKDATAAIRQKFENEIQNMSNVEHRHIAQFYAAYLHKKSNQTVEYGILMQPVAKEGTMEDLLSMCRRSHSKVSSEEKATLKKSFGCLASALALLHELMKRHKDLKPANLLIDEGKVLLTDFGSSFDGSAVQQMTTDTQDPKGHTWRYAAPEIKSGSSRNEKSDIFSMGGVFHEILCALVPEVPHYPDHYYEKADLIRSDLLSRPQISRIDASLPLIIADMLQSDPTARPSAAEIVARLSRASFCSKCVKEHQAIKKTKPTKARLTANENQISLDPQQFDQVFNRLLQQAELKGLTEPQLSRDERNVLARDPRARQHFFVQLHQRWRDELGEESDSDDSE